MVLLQISEPGGGAPEFRRRVAGVDLGTTNSLIALPLGDGRAEVLPVLDALDMLPSVVAWQSDGNTLVGDPSQPGAIASSKLLLARSLSEVQDKHPQLSLSPGPGNTVIIDTSAGGRTPIEVSAEILRTLASRAQQHYEAPLSGWVITVPALFNDAQRQATRDAAMLVGIPVLRLLNEPTAAALAYGLERTARGRVLVYDLGGGTFDVSILQLQEGIFEVMASGGDTQLGGHDLDLALGGHIAEQVQRDIPPQQLGTLARRLRERLSDKDEVGASLYGWNGSITRERFETLAAPLVDRTLNICERVLKDAGIGKQDISDVVLVGGATRTPLVRQRVQEWMGHAPKSDIDPDRVVAIGAAIQAGILAGLDCTDTLLLDVAPLSLGVETADGLVEILIPRNTAIPAQHTQEFTTARASQTGMDLHIVQGESPLAEGCRSLARFTLKGIPPMVAGAARVSITYQVDANGILSVSARELSTGVEAGIEVKPSHGLNEDDILQLLQRMDNRDEREQGELLQQRYAATTLIESLELAVQQDNQWLTQEDNAGIESALQTLRDCLDTDTRSTLDIGRAMSELEQAASGFAERRMNLRIQQALKGWQVEP